MNKSKRKETSVDTPFPDDHRVNTQDTVTPNQASEDIQSQAEHHDEHKEKKFGTFADVFTPCQ